MALGFARATYLQANYRCVLSGGFATKALHVELSTLSL